MDGCYASTKSKTKLTGTCNWQWLCEVTWQLPHSTIYGASKQSFERHTLLFVVILHKSSAYAQKLCNARVLHLTKKSRHSNRKHYRDPLSIVFFSCSVVMCCRWSINTNECNNLQQSFQFESDCRNAVLHWNYVP